VDKRAVLAALIAEVQRSLDVMIEAAKIAHAAATHEEMKPENDKDTRGLEAGYLARGQSQRAAEIERTLKELKALPLRPMDVVDTGALVELDSGARVFIAPGGGGVKLKVNGVDVQVVTLTSPLGEALEGKGAGDVAELNKRALEIVSVT
jgi:transcription elongation GreA/GreB family factor